MLRNLWPSIMFFELASNFVPARNFKHLLLGLPSRPPQICVQSRAGVAPVADRMHAANPILVKASSSSPPPSSLSVATSPENYSFGKVLWRPRAVASFLRAWRGFRIRSPSCGGVSLLAPGGVLVDRGEGESSRRLCQPPGKFRYLHWQQVAAQQTKLSS